MQEYISTDQRIHLLCQVLAKLNRNFVPEKEDFSHTTLSFDALGKRIVSQWINAEKEKIIMTLDLPDFCFRWYNESRQEIKKYSIHGKTTTQIETEIIADLGDLGLGDEGFTKKLKYKIPEYSFRDQAFERFEVRVLDKWMYHRNYANETCARFLRHLMVEDVIRIWPHHFDTGVYKEIDGKIGIGFGLAMQDSLVPSPYFYLSGYLLEGNLAFTDLPVLTFGEWDTGDWNGAVLPITDIKGMSESTKQRAVDGFISTALAWYMKSGLMQSE